MQNYYNVEDLRDFHAFKQKFKNLLDLNHQKLPLMIVCIGTDKATGDALGPYTGTLLAKRRLPAIIRGTLNEPVHAKNIQELNTHGYFVIAIDACLGDVQNINHIWIKDKPLYPGKGIDKDLPPIGNISIGGIVNMYPPISRFQYQILSHTRFYHIYLQAEFIAKAISSVLATSEFDVSE